MPLEIEILAVNDGSGDRTGGRTYAEGKKIGWRDGVAALWHIVRFNLFPPAKKIALRPSTSAATD